MTTCLSGATGLIYGLFFSQIVLLNPNSVDLSIIKQPSSSCYQK